MAENKSKSQAVQELRRSGAAGSHGDRRTKRLRTRQKQKDAAKSEYEDR